MNTLVKEYTTEAKLIEDVEKLEQRGIPKKNIYILSNRNERTEYVADEANANTIGMRDYGLIDMIPSLFKQGDEEIRFKIEQMGLTSADAKMYEERLNNGKILLFVIDSDGVKGWI